MPIAVEQRNVPLEIHAEARFRLTAGLLLIGVEYLEIELCREVPEPRRQVLDRVARKNRKARLWGHHEWTRMHTNL